VCDEYFVCEELDEAVASFFELADPHFTNVRTFSELATGNAATSRLTSRNGNATVEREAKADCCPQLHSTARWPK
jgi:hypothetical protein